MAARSSRIPRTLPTQLSPTARWGNTDAAGQITVRFRAPGTAGLANTVDASTTTIGQGSVTDAVYTTTASGATNLRITFVGPATADAGQTFEFLVEAVDGTQNVDATNTSTVTLTPRGVEHARVQRDRLRWHGHAGNPGGRSGHRFSAAA